jgi:hypothetical protein
MSRPANRPGKGERYVLLPHWMLKSPAWRTMSPNAKAVLLHLWERHNGVNNGGITYAVREGEDIGLSKDQTSRALAELIGRGFLKIARNSAFTLKTKEAREWTLTAEPVVGRAATKDFMFWPSAISDQHDIPSHKCDRPPVGKSKSRSHQRDARSHQSDHDGKDATKLPISVAPLRPADPEFVPARSRQRDTSSLPCRNVQFGDAARAERTRRGRATGEARGGVTANESNAVARVRRRAIDEGLTDYNGGFVRLGDVLDDLQISTSKVPPHTKK